DRNHIINLVASGMGVAEAIVEIKQPPDRTVEYPNCTKVRVPLPGEEEAFKEEELSDEKWLRQTCSRPLTMIPNPTRFIAAAIFYHRMSDIRLPFRKLAKKNLKPTKGKRRTY